MRIKSNTIMADRSDLFSSLTDSAKNLMLPKRAEKLRKTLADSGSLTISNRKIITRADSLSKTLKLSPRKVSPRKVSPRLTSPRISHSPREVGPSTKCECGYCHCNCPDHPFYCKVTGGADVYKLTEYNGFMTWFCLYCIERTE